MPKLPKSVLKQNLAQYRVWINDNDPFSRYFRLTQVPEALTGGKNAFLINGSPELVTLTDVLVEIIDSTGKTVFLQPIRNYVEGLARLISIEVYEDTAPGPATLTILGQLKHDANGNLPPTEFQQAYNVKWQKQISIAPLKPNTTLIRLEQHPKLDIVERLVPFFSSETGSFTTIRTGSVQTVGALNNVLLVGGFTMSRNVNGADFYVFNPATTSSFTSSITQVVTATQGLLSHSFKDSYGQQIPISSSQFKISYNEALRYRYTLLTRSFADIDLTKLTTLSGDIQRAKIYIASVDQPGNFTQIADVQLEASELTVTSSQLINLSQSPSSSTTASFTTRMGYVFSSDSIATWWNSGTISGSAYYVTGGLGLAYDDKELLDSVYVLTPTTYFSSGSLTPTHWLGLTRSLDFTEGLEYTLSGSLVCRKATAAMDARMDIYLVGESFPVSVNDPLGVRLASYTVPAGSTGRIFDDISVNFKALLDGKSSLRFVIYGGRWHISNVGVFSAKETGFNPDEVRVIVPVSGRRYERLIFKAELLDLNSNVVPINIESDPIWWDGGNVVFKGYDHRMEGRLTVTPIDGRPSGSIKITTDGFYDPNTIDFYSGSAIYVGEGTVWNYNTPFLFAATTGGLPWVSISDKLIGYIDTGSWEFILKIKGTIQVGSGSNWTDIRNFFPGNASVTFVDRTIGESADFYDLRGINSVSAGRWYDQIARMGHYTRGNDGFKRQPPLALPGFSGTLDPYLNTGSMSEFTYRTSGTLNVPVGQLVWNEMLYGSMSLNINQVAPPSTAGYMLNYYVNAGSSWVSFSDASSSAQSMISNEASFVSQTGSFSPRPDTIIDYPIRVPRQKIGTTLYVYVELIVKTLPAMLG